MYKSKFSHIFKINLAIVYMRTAIVGRRHALQYDNSLRR